MAPKQFGRDVDMRCLPCLLLLMSVLTTSQLDAQTAGDAVTGRRIVQVRCTGCHSLAPGTSTVIAPSFPDIALNRAKTEDYLRNWLTSPHAPMPDFRLSQDEIDDIIAFLRTLEKSAPDL